MFRVVIRNIVIFIVTKFGDIINIIIPFFKNTKLRELRLKILRIDAL